MKCRFCNKEVIRDNMDWEYYTPEPTNEPLVHKECLKEHKSKNEV